MLVGSFTRNSCVLRHLAFCARGFFSHILIFVQVKKRMREDVRAGGGRAPNGHGSRTGQNLREESPEAESDEEDEEQSYDHAQMPGR